MRGAWLAVAEALALFHVRASAAIRRPPPGAPDVGIFSRLRRAAQKPPAPGSLLDRHRAAAQVQRTVAGSASVCAPVASVRRRRWLRLMDESYTGGDVPPAIREALGAPSGAAALAAEGAWLERLLGSVPQDTFCHNDLQHGNIMELAGDGPEPGPALCFVDYEYSCYGPAQYDVANHFAECAMATATPFLYVLSWLGSAASLARTPDEPLFVAAA